MEADSSTFKKPDMETATASNRAEEETDVAVGEARARSTASASPADEHAAAVGDASTADDAASPPSPSVESGHAFASTSPAAVAAPEGDSADIASTAAADTGAIAADGTPMPDVPMRDRATDATQGAAADAARDRSTSGYAGAATSASRTGDVADASDAANSPVDLTPQVDAADSAQRVEELKAAAAAEAERRALERVEKLRARRHGSLESVRRAEEARMRRHEEKLRMYSGYWQGMQGMLVRGKAEVQAVREYLRERIAADCAHAEALYKARRRLCGATSDEAGEAFTMAATLRQLHNAQNTWASLAGSSATSMREELVEKLLDPLASSYAKYSERALREGNQHTGALQQAAQRARGAFQEYERAVGGEGAAGRDAWLLEAQYKAHVAVLDRAGGEYLDAMSALFEEVKRLEEQRSAAMGEIMRSFVQRHREVWRASEAAAAELMKVPSLRACLRRARARCRQQRPSRLTLTNVLACHRHRRHRCSRAQAVDGVSPQRDMMEALRRGSMDAEVRPAARPAAAPPRAARLTVRPLRRAGGGGRRVTDQPHAGGARAAAGEPAGPALARALADAASRAAAQRPGCQGAAAPAGGSARSPHALHACTHATQQGALERKQRGWTQHTAVVSCDRFFHLFAPDTLSGLELEPSKCAHAAACGRGGCTRARWCSHAGAAAMPTGSSRCCPCRWTAPPSPSCPTGPSTLSWRTRRAACLAAARA